MRPAILAVLSFSTIVASGAELILPSKALERDAPVVAVYRTNPQATGKGTLTIRWTDVLGRVIEDRSLPVELTDETEIRVPLDLRRAAAMLNEVTARLVIEGAGKNGKPDRRDETASASFIARPAAGWQDYMIMMWQPHSAERFATLKTLGINGGQYIGRSRTPPDFLLKNDLRWYAENIATDFYAEYHRYRPDRIQHWSFLQAKELYKKDPSNLEPFKRHPSLSDPAWLRTIHDRLVETAQFFSPYRPVFYDLADESGIGDLASFWDFDFSDHSLAQMRRWLQERYGTLAALNQQWGTAFPTWELVVPDTTNQAMKRADDNWSAWSDHKEWMDVAFARAIRMGVDAIRSVDREAYVGIAGAQMPGWGGYDYARLAEALTAVEPYDIGNNIEILRSLNPRLPFVTTAFARGPWEKHRIWYELLHGARGNIIWDEKQEMAPKEGGIGERGREVQPYYTEIRGGTGALLIASERQADPIAIHYSQPSMRVEWMLAQRPKGEAWVSRGSAIERLDSDFLRVRESYCKMVEDLGLQYRFVSYGQVAAGELLRRGYRVLILPRSSALSSGEASAIREFAAQGGLVISDGEPGVFDEHARRLPQPSLAGVPMRRVDGLSYQQDRLLGKERALLGDLGVQPRYAVLDEAGRPLTGVETHTFTNGGVEIVGVLSNPAMRVDELGPPEFKSNARFEKVRRVRLLLPAEREVYDVRAARSLGRQKELSIALDPYEPALFAFSAEPLPRLRVAGTRGARRGETARISVSFATASPAAKHVFHIDVSDPAGKIVPHYSANIVAPAGAAAHTIPLAVNDSAGQWTVRVHDLLSGQKQPVTISVE